MESFLMHYDGQWRRAIDGRTRPVMNPALDQSFAEVAWGGRADAQQAIAAANRALPGWSRTPLWQRAALCERLASGLEKNADVLVDILTRELGKPRHGEALHEARWAPRHFRVAAEQSKYFEGASIPVEDPLKRVLTIRQPRGVIAVITPWNFPAAIPAEYLPHAIVMGNTVVWTPAPTAAATAVTLMRLLEQAGLPPGVINLVIGPGTEVGDELVVNPDTHAIAMTGSPATGRIISARCGLKPRLMELGGNGPALVLPDADPVTAARAIAPTCFYAAGQVCVSAERIFVSDNLHKPFVDAIVKESQAWTYGDPLDANVNMGPLNNTTVRDKVDRHVKDAVARGAELLVGGRVPDRPGYFFEPTVIDGFTTDSLVNREETFGPVAPIASFGSHEQALDMVRSCPLGLTAAIFTDNVRHAWRLAEEIRTGIVIINDGSFFWEAHLPFGGMTGSQSSVGRLGGRSTLEFMSDVKTIAFHLGD